MEEQYGDSYLTPEELRLIEAALEEAHKVIPENSKSLEVDEVTSRFSSAIWYDKIKEKKIILAGIGGIGSYIVYLLSRLKVKSIIMFDDDRVEMANMSGQLYSKSDIGKYKVDAMADMISNYSDYNSVFAIRDRYTEIEAASDIMICGFDNMEARKIFFEKWLNHVNSRPEHLKSECIFIDGRLSAEEYQVLCIKGDDPYNIEKYKKDFLFSDNEADETICSYKQTTFMANMIASTIVNLFVNFVANQCNPLIDRDLPFFTTYNAETMFFKTEL